MKRAVFLVAAGATISAVWLMAQAPEVSMVDGFRTVEVVPVTCASVRVNPATSSPPTKTASRWRRTRERQTCSKKSQELDDTEHRMIPFIEKFRSIRRRSSSSDGSREIAEC